MSNEHLDLDSEETKDYNPGGVPLMPGGGKFTIWQLKAVAHLKSKTKFNDPGWYSFEVEVLHTDNPDILVGKVYKHTFNVPDDVTNVRARNAALRKILCAIANEDVKGTFKATPYLTKLCKLSASEELEKENLFGKTVFDGYYSGTSKKTGKQYTGANFDFAPVTDADLALLEAAE